MGFRAWVRETYDAARAAGEGLSERRADALLEKAQELVAERVTARPQRADRLAAMLRRTKEDDFAAFLRPLVVPDPRLALDDADTFRAHPSVRFTAVQMPILPAAALVPWKVRKGKRREEDFRAWTGSWLGGRPSRLGLAEWPRTAEGAPLAHVLQAVVGDELDLWRRLGFGSRGVLQICHDLETYGEPEDAGSGAWLVRFTPLGEDESERLAAEEVVEFPDDLEREATTPARVVAPDLVPTVASPLDMGGVDDATWERYDRVLELFEWHMRARTGRIAPGTKVPKHPYEGGKPIEPSTRLGGYGYNETNSDYVDILDEMLPLAEGDRHVMLADVNPSTFTDEDWFHGGRHLQVWIRASDLTAGRFDRVWCFIRTDG